MFRDHIYAPVHVYMFMICLDIRTHTRAHGNGIIDGPRINYPADTNCDPIGNPP